MIAALKSMTLTPRLILEEYVRTKCHATETTNGVFVTLEPNSRSSTMSIGAIGYNNIRKEVEMDILELVEFKNHHGLTCSGHVILGVNPDKIITLGMDVMPGIGIRLTGLSATGDSQAPRPFETIPDASISFPEEDNLSPEDATLCSNLLVKSNPGQSQIYREPK
ncbi:hypothetical protein HDU99_003870 [Rhizoclosmatium hyalinum]|nr:hypothetical protein HDU99_003870 [Rhizoclosmatium hyalinum]